MQLDLPSKGFNGKLVFVTGEYSGEIHASRLIEMLKEGLKAEYSGIGSARLAAAGVRIIYDYGNISLTGLSEIFVKLKYIKEAYDTLKRHLREEKPSLVVLVDFPGFNLKVARIAKRLGIPVIYFIPPQIWAWRESRIKFIRRFVDKVICILPFEKELYDRYGVDAAYVGHPFVETVKPTLERGEFLKMIGASEDAVILTIMPGSRENEITKHMPLLLEVVERLEKRIRNLKVVLPLAESVEDRVSDQYRRKNIVFLKGLSHDALSHSHVAIVKSGSSTLEAAILGTPSIVVYKVSPLSYFVAKAIVKVKYISLPNIIMGKEVFPEFIQCISAEDVAEKVIYMLKNGKKGVKEDMDEIRNRLGSYDSYRLAKEAVLQFLECKYGALS